MADGDDDWVSLRAADGQMLCFQRVDEYRAPPWRGQAFRVFLDPAGHPFCRCQVGH